MSDVFRSGLLSRLATSPLTSLFALGRAPVLTLPLEGGEDAWQPAFRIVASANIAAGGEATTAYGFAAPSGKTGGDFFTGRRWDDENAVDALTLTSGGWTKVGWAVQANASAVVDGEQYEFRVVEAYGVDLDVYSVTPTWTIGNPPASSLLLPQSLLQRIPALRMR
ncbi:MAG TPA: hypothetical protein PL196_00120 [Burkholderiaceae bacterium]|nr:hypothetical protein [Burkholderiaceae bacterium]